MTTPRLAAAAPNDSSDGPCSRARKPAASDSNTNSAATECVRAEVGVSGEVDRERERHRHGRRLWPAPTGAVFRRNETASEHKHDREHAQDDQSERQPFRSHAQTDPRRFVEDGARQAEQRQRRPAAPLRQEHHRDVEQQDVAEQTDRPIGARGEQQRRREAAGQAEQRDLQRRMPSREHAAGGRDGDHEHEAGAHRHQAVARARRPEGGVENDDSRAGQRIGGAGVGAAQRHLGGADAADADDGADHHAQPGRNEAVLDGVLEEQQSGERERNAAEHCGRPHAEEAFPVDRRHARP